MTRPTIFKHKWWRFWRRSYWGLNPWRWDVQSMPKNPGDCVYFDGMHYPGDGLGGAFGISNPLRMHIDSCTTISMDNSGWYAERIPLVDGRSWLQRKPMYGLNPFYRMHANDVKWFGGEG